VLKWVAAVGCSGLYCVAADKSAQRGLVRNRSSAESQREFAESVEVGCSIGLQWAVLWQKARGNLQIVLKWVVAVSCITLYCVAANKSPQIGLVCNKSAAERQGGFPVACDTFYFCEEWNESCLTLMRYIAHE